MTRSNTMNYNDDYCQQINRRYFFGKSATGLGTVGLASLLNPALFASGSQSTGGRGGLPHFPPQVRRVIYLFQSGGPAQMDLFDYKPELKDKFGQELPKSVYPVERKTTMTAAQSKFPVAPSTFRFSRHGEAGTWVSELLPYTAQLADRLCVLRSMSTEAINHDPAITFLQTGSQIPGRPSMGAWLNYGLGTENSDLPAFVAMSSRGTDLSQPLYDRLWGSGFLPTRYQGVKFRNQGDPVLDIGDPHARLSVELGTIKQSPDCSPRYRTPRRTCSSTAALEQRYQKYEIQSTHILEFPPCALFEARRRLKIPPSF